MTDFASMQLWNREDANRVNPIRLYEEDSSVDDSMLSSIEPRIIRRSMPKKKPVKSVRVSYSSSSSDDESGMDDLSKNPFVEDDLSQNPFSGKNNAKIAGDDLSKNPFLRNNKATSNPFGRDDLLRDRAVSDSDESSEMDPLPLSMYLEEEKNARASNPFGGEEDSSDDGDDDDDDIIESSKRLLRSADQRIQYQHQRDEIMSLKEKMKRMEDQAEAMAEQLRRAIETKCDLVLAQNEMERNHEQTQIAKEAEIKDLRLYIQEIIESQANSELNFMNEIASLARIVENNKAKHAKLIEHKDYKITQLENKIESMKVSASNSESFHKRFGKNNIIDLSNEWDITAATIWPVSTTGGTTWCHVKQMQ